MTLTPDMLISGIDERLVCELYPDVDETTRHLPWMQPDWIRQEYAGTLEKYNKTFGDFVQTYNLTRDDPERIDWHHKTISELTGIGPDRKPDPGEKHWNPLLTKIWLPWAHQARFLAHKDLGLAASKYGLKFTEKLRNIAIDNYSYAVPTTPILEYMVARAPSGKIIDVGAGTGYWAKLLSDCGGDLIAIDNHDDIFNKVYYPIKHGDAIKYFACYANKLCVQKNRIDDRALFLCWPRQDDSSNNPFAKTDSLAESVLTHYRGDIIFFVGEYHLDMGGSSYDFKTWIDQHKDWVVELEIPLPTWPTIHDVFICATRIKN